MTRAQIESLAAAYEAAPIVTPEARRAYRVLARYTRERFADAVAEGWRFLPSNESQAPPADLAAVRESRRMEVYDADHAHPALSDGENFMFRAVHDVFGHLGLGAEHDFTFEGEVLACQTQAADFRRWERIRWDYREPLAALFTEVVAQAAYFEVHGRFPVQKAALLNPAEYEVTL